MFRVPVNALLFATLWLWLVIGEADPLGKPAPLHLTHGDASLDAIPSRGILNFRSASPNSASRQSMEALRSLLAGYFQGHPKESRYTFSIGPYEELNVRMAAVASCSTQWDFRIGKIRSGDTAAWLREQLAQAEAHQELVPVFAEFGYAIDIASLESILLCKASEIDWGKAQRPCQGAIPPKAKLPCGALITFNVSAK